MLAELVNASPRLSPAQHDPAGERRDEATNREGSVALHRAYAAELKTRGKKAGSSPASWPTGPPGSSTAVTNDVDGDKRGAPSGQPDGRFRTRRRCTATRHNRAGGETLDPVKGPDQAPAGYGGRFQRYVANSLGPGPAPRGKPGRRQMTRQAPRSDMAVWPPGTAPVRPTNRQPRNPSERDALPPGRGSGCGQTWPVA
jgi:hypothetical protein